MGDTVSAYIYVSASVCEDLEVGFKQEDQSNNLTSHSAFLMSHWVFYLIKKLNLSFLFRITSSEPFDSALYILFTYTLLLNRIIFSLVG